MRNARWVRKLQRFAALSLADKWLLLRAAGWLGVARLQLGFLPFERLAARLSDTGGTATASVDPEILRRVRDAVSAAAASVPWRADCFPQSIAASKILRSFGYASSIHLGVAKAGDSELLGHAWLTCGETVVTGGQELDRYVEIHRLGE